MLDVFDLPSAIKSQQTIIYANSATNGVGWTVYNKPRGVTFVHIFLLGGGGGGGNGTVGGVNAAGGGGAATLSLIPT